MGCHFLLQGIFPTQGSNPGLPHCRQTLYLLSHEETWGRLEMRRGRGQCRQGEMVTRGRHRTPRPTHSPEWLLGPSGCWPSPHAEAGRIGAKRRPVCSEHRGWGQAPRFVLPGIKVRERGEWAAVPAASPTRLFSGCHPSSQSGTLTNLGTCTSELRPRMV